MGWNRRNTTGRHGTLSDVITSFSLEKRYSFVTSLLSYYKGRYIRTTSLSLSQILSFFKIDNVTLEIPSRPSGGELFVFKQPDILKKDDWKADGHL